MHAKTPRLTPSGVPTWGLVAAGLICGLSPGLAFGASPMTSAPALIPRPAQNLPEVPVPPGNELTEAKIQLGRTLFWDEQLSATKSVACGTCHLPEAGGSDPRAWMDPASVLHPGPDGELGTDDDRIGSLGVPERHQDGEAFVGGLFGDAAQVTDRRPRTVIGAAFMASAFWDGRAGDVFVDPLSGEEILPWAAALETQSLKPLFSTVEMGAHGRAHSHVVRDLVEAQPLGLSPEIPESLIAWIDGRSYPELFDAAFGSSEMPEAHFAMALASYQRTLIPSEAPVLSKTAMLTELELAGNRVFRRKGCADCHESRTGLFTDQSFHYIGQAPLENDPGLAAISGEPDDAGLFLTPTLLNVELRAPYFHDGSKATLDEVLDFYSRGGDHGTARQREIVAANFTPAERVALKAFLGRPFTDLRAARATGPFERPLLSTESDARHTAAVRGISGPGSTPLRETPSLIQAEARRPFTAFLPGDAGLLRHRPFVRLAAVDTGDLMAMNFSAPPVVPVAPVFIGTTVLADFRPLFADRTIRSTVTLAVEATL